MSVVSSAASTKSGKSAKSVKSAKSAKNKEEEEVANKVKLLVRKRGQAMAKVTNTKKTVDTIGNDLTPAQLLVFQKQLNNYYSEWHFFHDQILDLVDDEQVQDHMDNCNKFEEHYAVVLTVLETVSLAQAAPARQEEKVVFQQQPLKVPMPSFDGKYENWPKFKSMFLDLMSRSRDSDAIKLYHLDKALVGSAAGFIDAKTINDNNYEHAWNMLEEQYENLRIIVDTHIRGLLSLKKMTKESYKELKELLDECTRHVANLEYHGQELTGVSELMVVNLLSEALDKGTRKNWESTLARGELPTYEDTVAYLKAQCNVLERCEAASASTKSPQTKSTAAPKTTSYKSHAATTAEKTSTQCDFCAGDHINFSCPDFAKLSTNQRTEKVKAHRLCFNCLQKGHSAKECRSKNSCRKCEKRHHTLLHFENAQPARSSHAQSAPKQEESKPNVSPKPESVEPLPSGSSATSCVCNQPQDSQVFLMTAIAQVVDNSGVEHQCRILLDCASQVSTIRAGLAAKLDLPTRSVNTVVVGVNGKRSNITHEVSVSLQSMYDNFRATVDCLVMEEVTSNLPTVLEDVSSWELPSGIQLADPSFFVPGEVDLLLGAKHFWSAMKSGKRKLGPGFPELRETQFGWVVVGAVQQFWKMEQVPESPTLSSEEESCEEFYQRSHKRDGAGRYVVGLPFKEGVVELGESRSMALRRFLFLERRLEKDPELKHEYSKFLREYEELGHCELVDETKDKPGTKAYYMPHHAVLRPSSTSTKLRVVFDASAKSSSGTSLNDLLMVGPRFKTVCSPSYCAFASVHHSSFQRIFWREKPGDPLKVFGLSTVTYGTASAPFLATRTLVQLAEDEQKEFPIGAKLLKESFYVDDCLCGFETLEEAAQAIDELRGILSKGGFPIHKWCSNSQQLLDLVPKDEWEKRAEILHSSVNQTVKTLGLLWEPETDQFLFRSSMDTTFDDCPTTKRLILSTVARIFDPLGLISPVIVEAKLLIQDIWAKGLDWDQPVQGKLLQRWIEIRSSLRQVSEISFPRLVNSTNAVRRELHGFADASKRAYGASVYLRCVNPDGSVTMHLLCSKSRNAPTPEITIPKLELCAAKLLAELMVKVIEAVKMDFDDIVLWSDSQIVLAWLKKDLHQLSGSFVKNRVADIVALTNQFTWKYVRSKENPADIVSRGKPARELKKDNLWSSFRKLQRVFGFVLRFVDNCRRKDNRVVSDHLTIGELRRSLKALVRLAQHTSSIGSDIKRVERGDPCKQVQSLNPFIEDGVIRVGGRIQKSKLSYETKHPMILPHKHPIVTSLIRALHKEHLHVGPSGLLAAVRQRFWLINGRSAVREVTHRCMTCFRSNPSGSHQLMGNLPECRVVPSAPFESTGVDFAGPVYIKYGIRRPAVVKAYISVFICMTTRAIHLELVSDLTSEAFLAALRRFTCRRGYPRQMLSDNGLNFVGANKDLKELVRLFKEKQTLKEINEFCEPREIEWNFIPPRAPNFGGYWEAGVKSVKTHLKRVLGKTPLSFEEYATVLTQVEAILNSRPLFAHSSDPTEPTAITPAIS
ncbi:uncharacterized protein LOC119769333 [Culex quinquefasciatus]|uniref:uncharacterized protein LOC119769333 n=1 Tax=Culex quinquefasciatus TaxID=7176 RepID=UPI0018E2CDA1|nr:uncharacterized protein LOC119769333 [Culex quinquefasciatus]